MAWIGNTSDQQGGMVVSTATVQQEGSWFKSQQEMSSLSLWSLSGVYTASHPVAAGTGPSTFFLLCH